MKLKEEKVSATYPYQGRILNEYKITPIVQYEAIDIK